MIMDKYDPQNSRSIKKDSKTGIKLENDSDKFN